MRIHCINTNKENCYAIINDGGQVLLLDAGVSKKKIIASLHNAGVTNVISSIAGCLVTHRHGDHCKSVADLVADGVDCYGPFDVQDTIIVDDGNTYAGNGFTFQVIEVPHDLGVHCFAYSIEFAGKRIMYATDLSYFPATKSLPHFDLLLIENNWNAKGMIESDLHFKVKQRIKGTHLQDAVCHRMLVQDKLFSFDRCLFVHRSGTTYRDAFKFPANCEFIKPGATYDF